MFDLLVYSPAFLDVRSLKHPISPTLKASSSLHTVVAACAILQTSEVFPSMIRYDATGSSG